MQDEAFEKIVCDMWDYGLEVNFSIFGGAGAYQPFALSTERLDTPEKEQQFAQGFWRMSEIGALKCQIRLSAVTGLKVNIHSFLHEAMHFHQDMYGLYLMPLQEDGVFPVIMDAKSNIVAILFNEAWAQVEALRASYAIMRDSGDPRGWEGALKSPDWAVQARSYVFDMEQGMDDTKAAAKAFKRWYKSKHRNFYEAHALEIYKSSFARYKEAAGQVGEDEIAQKLRLLELPHLITKIPEAEIPAYFHEIDWTDPLYTKVEIPLMGHAQSDNPNIQDIKCGSPPYIWNRLRQSEKANSEVPPP